jgi:hypothetical protein
MRAFQNFLSGYAFLGITALMIFTVIPAAFPQFILQGSVTDLGEHMPLDGVRVELEGTGDRVYSNLQGNFRIIQGGTDYSLTDTLTGELVIRDKELAWHFNTSVSIEIINQLGGLYLRAINQPEFGRLQLSGIRNGMFLIRVISPKGMRMYSLFSTSENFMLSDFGEEYTTWKLPGILLTDTLIFSRDGYYTRELPVQNDENFLEVELLKFSYQNLNYLNDLISRPAFDMLSSSPPSGHVGEVESLKLIYDSDRDLVYFMNTGIHENHYLFAKEFMGFNQGEYSFQINQYTNSALRYLYPATLNYYKSLNLYTFEFFPGDGATCEDVEMLYDKILEYSFLGDNLYFYASHDSWKNCNSVPSVTSNELFEGQNFQALNIGEAYGYLKRVEIDKLENTDLTRHDILLVNGIPINIPVISGIITTEFQTPLSHINVLSHNRGTPNMCLRDGFSNPALDTLTDRLVYLKVEYDRFMVRAASPAEASAFWLEKEPRDTQFLTIDTLSSGIIDLNTTGIADIKTIGGKAANYAELINAFTARGEIAPVPEIYFAIPFYYYRQHLRTNGIDQYISEQIADPAFKESSRIRQEVLERIRNRIVSAPIDAQLISLVNEQIGVLPDFSGFRFRSSTNAEDIEGFNGAGLYDSFTGRPGNPSQSVETAIRRVWASLWNYPAFEEREYFKISHATCAMGILVHRSFPGEDANGVAITKNPYGSNHAFIINVQVGENSIVFPEPGVLHDQVILYTFSISGNEPFTCEYITISNLLPPGQEYVMTKQELFQLGTYLLNVKNYYYQNVYQGNTEFKDFGLDIEFKLDSEVSPRKLYLKQVRPY